MPRFKLAKATLVLAVCLTQACAVTYARRPTISPEADLEGRKKIYQDYRLTEHRTFFTQKWRRADGEYNLAELDFALRQYPKTTELKDQIVTQRVVAAVGAGIGGGLLGYGLGEVLFHPSGERTPDSAVPLMIAGGAVIVVATIVSLIWDPSGKLADTYNDSLSQDLKLSGRLLPLTPTPVVIRSRGQLVPGVGAAGTF